MRRLCETGAFLVLSEGLEKGAVMRSKNGGEASRVAVASRDTAKNLALRDWIKITKNASISIYHATEAGRAALASRRCWV